MNGKDIFLGLKYIGEDLIDEAEYGAFPQNARKTEPAEKHPGIRRPLLVAALIALTLLLVGCTVAYVLSLQDMKIGESTFTQRKRQFDESGEMYIVETEVLQSVISLQGLEGTPGFQAAKEWQEFEESLDPLEILEALDENTFEKPREYDAYGVCTPEMLRKVDEIVEKYGLKLAGQSAPFQREETDFFLDSLELPMLHDENAAQVEYMGGYFYECGNFNVEFQISVPGWKTRLPDAFSLGALRYHDKDYFYPIHSIVFNEASCQQWNHTLPGGQEVLIVRDDSLYAKVFCNRADAIVYLCFVDGYVQQDGTVISLTNEEVQMAVDAFDFSIRPRKPDMEAVNAYLDAAYAKAMAEQEAKMETYVDPFALESYGEYVDYLIGQTEKSDSLLYGRTADNIYYTIMDFNGDGVEDFLHGPGENVFNTVVTMKDGTTELLYGRGSDSYLCEGGIIEESYTKPGRNNYYRFMKYKNNEVTERWNFEFDYEKQCWFHITFNEGPIRTQISEETVQSVVDSYKRIDLNMKPLSEFPASS